MSTQRHIVRFALSLAVICAAVIALWHWREYCPVIAFSALICTFIAIIITILWEVTGGDVKE
jgi:hypothetical protein